VIGQATFTALKLPTLDGSKSSCKWDTDPDAAVPGIFGPSHIPRMFRRDYVHNGNDSHWLTNPHQPLEGFAQIIGNERTQRSLRTRLGLIQIEDRLAGRDGLPGNKFTLQDLQDIALGDRQYAGELWRDQLVQLCKDNPMLIGSNGPVDVSGACPVLAAWDLHDNLDSKGAILFRRFASRALAAGIGPVASPVAIPGAPGPFKNPFSVNDPVHTPNGLDTSNPAVRTALADAVNDLKSSNIPLDATLRQYQFSSRGDQKIPIHGGPGTLGVFNAINVIWKAGVGYPDVPHGSSFIMAMQFVKAKCPVQSRTFVTYGESENPNSPRFNDQTKAFSDKRWNKERFCEPDIKRDKALKVFKLRGR
jgi:acyl-homoserine-lactone acylase